MTAKPKARRGSPLYLPSAFDLFKPSRDLVLDNLHVFGWLFALPLIFWVHSWLWTPAAGGHFWNRFTDANYSWTFPSSYNAAFIGFSILWFVIAIAAGTIVQIMSQKAQLEVSSGKRPELGELWTFVKLRWLSMLKIYVSVIGITLLGFVLIIPRFIFLRRYFLAPYVMIEKNCSVKEAMRRSADLSRTNTGSVWGVIGVLFLIDLLGILPLIGSLASFAVGSLYSVAPALRYQQLKKLT